TRQLGQLGLLAYALAVKSVSHDLALVVTLTVAALLVAGAVRRRDDDLASYTLIAVATLYATPIVWGDYFGLLIVPAALYGGWLWAAIPLLWVTRLADAGHSRPSWLIAGYLAITALFVFRALRPEHRSVEVSPERRPEQVVPTLVEAG